MMPELGRYAGEVLAAYAVALAGLGAIVGISLARGARVRRQLRELERRRKTDDA